MGVTSTFTNVSFKTCDGNYVFLLTIQGQVVSPHAFGSFEPNFQRQKHRLAFP